MDYQELIERLRYERDDGAREEAANAIESLQAELENIKRPDFREMREMLRAMQAGELTVSRGIEILKMWSAGNWNDDMLPPVRQDLIEEDSMPVEIIDRLKAELAKYRDAHVVAYRHLMEDGWEYFDAPTGDDCPKCVPLIIKPDENQ